jgi:hypothetical protein
MEPKGLLSYSQELSTGRNLDQISPVHTTTYYLFNIHLSIIIYYSILLHCIVQ